MTAIRQAPLRSLRHLATALLVVLACLGALPAPAAPPAERAQVLVLMSYHLGHSWEDRILQGISAWGADGDNGARPDFHVEWMDSKRHADAAQRDTFARYLAAKHAGRRFDLILTVDDNALDFVVRNDALFGGVPVVFSGVNGDPAAIVGTRAGVTGIPERFDLARTLHTALTLHAGVGRVVFITPADETGAGLRDTAQRALTGVSAALEVEHWVSADLSQIAPRLATLPADAVLFVLGAQRAAPDGRMLEPEEVVAFVHARTPLPVYSDLDLSVGHGAVGGYLNSGFATGRLQAELARRVLAGTPADALPLATAPVAQLFDHAELRRLGIDPSALPAGSTLVNAPASIFDPRHRALLVGIALLVAALLLTVTALAVRTRLQSARQAALRHQATHDDLTGLPNRAWLADYLQDGRGAPAEGEHLALVMLDLNRFKLVNDTYGHSFGDEVVVSVARRLHESLIEGEALVRFSGDAFVILAPFRNDAALASLRERCMRMLAEPFIVHNRRIPISAAFGLAVAPAGNADHDRLLREADTAMYEAKRSGREQVVSFDSRIQERAVRQFELEASLPAALEQGEITVDFQPIVDAVRGHIAGFEALARWRHPELGQVPPPEFIRAATDSGRIGRLTQTVLRQSCRAFAAHLTAPQRPYLSVNVSVSDIYADDFPSRLATILADEGVPPDRLVLEVTEDTLLGDVRTVTRALARLRELGVRIAIDDFGTGYSSMSYLSNFMVNIIKIDQSFVRNIASNPLDHKIVRAIVSMAADLELSVITEGVENDEQIALLRRLGCVLLQGYAYGRPRPAAEWADSTRLAATS